MIRKVAPTLNLENLTCVIRCCAYPSTADEGDGGDEDNRKDGDVNEDGQQDSSTSEKDLHGPEKSSKFFLTLPSLRRSKKINSKIKLQDVTDWLETQKSYTFHHRIKTKFRRRKVLTRGVQYQYQADLVDYSKLKRDNSGYTFVLSIIDCFSQLVFAIPIKRKTGD